MRIAEHIRNYQMNGPTQLKKIGLIVCISIGLIVLIDVTIGSSILSFVSGSSEKYYRIRHHQYHHTFRSNVDTDRALWGSNYYRVCTNEFGFKSKCDIEEKSPGTYSVAFMGDSVTEGIGMTYSESIVGIVDEEFPELAIANFGVASYSPKIYLSKTKHLLKQGISFEHLFVLIDISDIMDDGATYIYQDGNVYDALYRSESSGNTIDSTGVFIYKLKIYVDNYLPITYELLKTIKSLLNGTFSATDKEPENSDQATKNEQLLIQQKPVFNLDRGSWTYNPDAPEYGPLGVEGAIKQSVRHMIELHELLASHGIDLSVGVYPWPGQLAHDTSDSLQARIWSDFCESRCVNFVNMFPFFFEQIENYGLADTYRKYYIDGDVHFNVAGNTTIARAIVDQLRKDHTRRSRITGGRPLQKLDCLDDWVSCSQKSSLN